MMILQSTIKSRSNWFDVDLCQTLHSRSDKQLSVDQLNELMVIGTCQT